MSKNLKYISKFFIIGIIFIVVFGFFQKNKLVQANTNDAIAVRVIENINKVSPMRWYQENVDTKGSPSEIMVNGYRGIRDGRTVYVSAANFILNGDPSDHSINIYILSYTQNADSSTVDIFGQLLDNWRFNANFYNEESTHAIGQCVSAEELINNESSGDFGCEIDYDCGLNSDLYCNSTKAKIIRDVQRLADFYEIKYALKQFGDRDAEQGYCVNVNSTEGLQEETQTDVFCYNTVECPTALDGVASVYCNYEKFPALNSGSYIKNYSTSIWPSWQEELSSNLGTSLPMDPINKMICVGSGGYDSNTCWDDINKSFGGDLDNAINYIYTYFYNKLNSSYSSKIKTETNYFYP